MLTSLNYKIVHNFSIILSAFIIIENQRHMPSPQTPFMKGSNHIELVLKGGKLFLFLSMIKSF